MAVSPADHTADVRCPTCGAAGLLIVYGMPAEKLSEAANRGEVVIGGCTVDLEGPTRECPAGHRWRPRDDPSGARCPARSSIERWARCWVSTPAIRLAPPSSS